MFRFILEYIIGRYNIDVKAYFKSTMTTRNQIDLQKLQAAASGACTLLKTLSNPDRLLLLCQMTQGEFSVGDLEALTGIRQPTLSQQLTVLREERLVRTRRDGKQIFYSVASDEALAVLDLLYELYCPKA